MYSELQDSRLTLMEVMDEYVERRVLSEATHYGANTFIKSKLNLLLQFHEIYLQKQPKNTNNALLACFRAYVGHGQPHGHIG